MASPDAAGGSARPIILFVDDEPLARKQFARLVGPDVVAVCVASAAEARDYLARNERTVSVVLSDHRMPEESGVDLLTETRRQWPQTRRVLTTAYADTDSLAASINRAGVHRLVLKPWNVDLLRQVIRQEVLLASKLTSDFHHVERHPITALVALETVTSLLSIDIHATEISSALAACTSAQPNACDEALVHAECIRGEIRTARQLLAVVADVAQSENIHADFTTVSARRIVEATLSLSRFAGEPISVEVTRDFMVETSEIALSAVLACLLTDALSARAGASACKVRIVISAHDNYGVIAIIDNRDPVPQNTQDILVAHTSGQTTRDRLEDALGMPAIGGFLAVHRTTSKERELRLCFPRIN